MNNNLKKYGYSVLTTIKNNTMNKSFITIVILLIATNFISYFLGSHTILFGYSINPDGSTGHRTVYCENTKDRLANEIAYCNAWIDLAHHYLYENNPAYCDECDSCSIEQWEATEKHNYWLDVVSESDYYQRIQELNGGNWEDFYEDLEDEK